MAAVTAFNDLLRSFLAELAEVFPEERKIRAFAAGLPALLAVSERKALDVFVDAIRDHVALIVARDPAVFPKLDAWGIDFSRMWRGNLSPGTRMAIWDYLHALVEYAANADAGGALAGAMATAGHGMEKKLTDMAMECTKKIENGEVDMARLMDTVFAKAPPELMQSIESLAAECAEKMQSGSMDLDAMMKTVMCKLKDMDLSALEGADSGELTRALGSLGLDPGMLNLASLAMSGDGATDDLLALIDKPAAKKKKSNKKSTEN